MKILTQKMEIPAYAVFLAVAPLAFLTSLLGVHAIAQEALPPAGSGGGVDFAPELLQVLDYAGGLLATALSALTLVGVRFLFGRIGLQNSQLEHHLATRADEILHLAIQNGFAWMKVKVADPNSPVRHVEVNNMLLEFVINRVKGSMPDIIKKFKWTDEAIKQMVMSRLDRYMMTPDADTGTPVLIGEKQKVERVSSSVIAENDLQPVKD